MGVKSGLVNTRNAVNSFLSNPRWVGADLKAWLATGLDELRQVFSFGTQQIQSVSMPGQLGIPTTGEATVARREGKESYAQDMKTLAKSMDVPPQDGKEAAAPSAEASHGETMKETAKGMEPSGKEVEAPQQQAEMAKEEPEMSI